MGSLNLEWVFLKIYNLFTGAGSSGGGNSGFKNFIIFMLTLITIFFLSIIIYSVIKIRDRQIANRHKLHDAIHAVAHHHHEEKDDKRWRMILDFITSNNPSDWRLAVIEADNILDELTKELGFVGDNLGERLRNAPASHFKTLNNAWEAHKVRNKIAHEGMSYEMPYREAKKAIELYESVFTEFEYI
jgi:hypothetical protein